MQPSIEIPQCNPANFPILVALVPSTAGLGVTGRSNNGELLPLRPIAGTPPVMCDGKNAKLLCGDLIDDAVWEPTEDISPTSATKYSTAQRIVQNEICRSFELGHKCETKLDIRFQRIERGRVV